MISTDDAKAVGEALLATVKKLMTGSEIAACEWTKEPEFEDECGWYFSDYDGGGDNGEDLESTDVGEKWHRLQRLENAFPREIANWINKRNAARSRKAVKGGSQ